MSRETFGSRLGLLASLIGVAIGLGNVWRFPYMVGRYGGAAFVAVYLLAVLAIGVPALMAEWSLGRAARRGPVGAYARAALPGGTAVGWFFFATMVCALGYYANAIGWVLFHGAAELARGVGWAFSPGKILPPETGLDGTSLSLQLFFSALVLAFCSLVALRGLRRGIERASKVLTPILFVTLLVLIARSVTLPGAGAGIEWYILKVDFASLTPSVLVAGLGQAIFSLSLGGTMMVVYGSYVSDGANLRRTAAWTALGDLGAGLLAGLAILPAVFAFGLEPGSGPGLIFFTLPRVFELIPAGWLFGVLFFGGLAGAALLSAQAAFEVLVAGLTDGARWPRRRAVPAVAVGVLLVAVPPMINMEVFLPWDLAFGSGVQTLGVLMAVIAVAWCMQRSQALEQLGGETPGTRFLYLWLRFVIPCAILGVGVWWLLTEVIGVAPGV